MHITTTTTTVYGHLASARQDCTRLHRRPPRLSQHALPVGQRRVEATMCPRLLLLGGC